MLLTLNDDNPKTPAVHTDDSIRTRDALSDATVTDSPLISGRLQKACVESITMERSPRKFLRSSQMVSALKEHLLYSEKKPRDFLFDAIEAIITDAKAGGTPLIVSRLIRDAADLAKEYAQPAQFDFRNWTTTAKAVVNAMLSAGVLCTPAGDGITSQAAEVSEISDDFRDRTEAFLLEFLIRKLGDVSLRDNTALTHALFRQFDTTIPVADLEDRVALLLARLADRIELSPEGTYRDLGLVEGQLS
jgi:hypothetical protein